MIIILKTRLLLHLLSILLDEKMLQPQFNFSQPQEPFLSGCRVENSDIGSGHQTHTWPQIL